MKRIAGLAAAVLMLTLAGTASAATLFVDDDGADCGGARFATIQAAIDAAAPGDTIRVCRGVYAEQPFIRRDKVGLVVRSLPARAAEIVPPAGGMVLAPVTEDPRALALVKIRAEDVLFRDFRLSGPLTPSDLNEACAGPGEKVFAGIDVLAAPGTRLDGNHLTDMVVDCSSIDGSRPSGVGVTVRGFGRTVVDRSHITGSTVGILFDDGDGTAQRNVIVGQGRAVGAGIRLFVSSAKLQANDISATNAGVDVFSSFVRVFGNHLHDNDLGFDADQQVAGELRANHVVGNTSGIFLRGVPQNGVENNLHVRRNRVVLNTNFGIAVFADRRLSTYLLEDNRALDNGLFDCFDETRGDGTAGTANTWRDNVGVKDSPNVCRRP
jgi:hypothetical protein